jgi:hypothetical protein
MQLQQMRQIQRKIGFSCKYFSQDKFFKQWHKEIHGEMQGLMVNIFVPLREIKR